MEKIQSIEIRFIPQTKQRYQTTGDWFFDGATLAIMVTQQDDPRYAILVAVHELVEGVVCTQNGVTPEQVDDFDMGQGLDYDEPGMHPSAPYHKEHLLALALERKLANALGVDWDTYNREVTDKGVKNGDEAANA